jgi:hypothetical protein
MKSPLFKSLVAASLLFALGSTTRAQVMTSDTITGFDAATLHAAGLFLPNGQAGTQTFSSITSFDQATFRFVAAIGDTFGASTVDYALTQWAGAGASDGAVAAISGIPFLTTAISDSGSWVTDGSFKYFDAEFDLSALGAGLDDSLTYGFSLVGTASSSAAGYLIGGSGNAYAGGSGYLNLVSVSNYNDLTVNNSDFGQDLAFAGSLSPVPEASSAAVLFSGLFVGTMMFSRSRRRRVVATADTIG